MSTRTQSLPATTSVLNATDRCDRCGALAYVAVILKASVTLPKGGSLMFCAHHGRDHLPKLRAKADHIFDESERLHQENASSAPSGER